MQKNKKICEYLDDYLFFIDIEKGLSAKTQENYGRFLNVFFRWLKNNNFENLKPGNIDADLIWKYRVYLSRNINPKNRKSLSKATQNYYLIALRSFLDFFSIKKITSLSPKEIKLARDKSDKEVYALSIKEIERLLLAPDIKNKIGLRDRAILETLFSTGLRVTELTALDKNQIPKLTKSFDFEISISGKGRRVRTVYFSERSAGWLKKYLEKRFDSDDSLFINYKKEKNNTNKSKRLTARSVENIVKKYVKIAGLPNIITPHTIRHTFATDLLYQGADLRLVQEFLGHKNIATTQIYTHVTNKQLRDAHEKVHKNRKI